MRRTAALVLLPLVSLGFALGLASCGAEDKQAPAPAPRPEALAACESFEELMPRFVHAVSSGRTEGLRRVISENLFIPARPGEPPVMNDLLRAVFATLGRFAREAPERGAPVGELCAEPPPPLDQSHPLCEMRRVMKSMVHEGEGLALFRKVDPLFTALLDYVIGRVPSSAEPHYEVATILSGMCSQTASCQMEDTLDLLLALTDIMRTERGRGMLERFDALVNHPSLQPFLSDDGQQYGGEKGIVALAQTVITVTQGMDHPDDLDALPLSSLPVDLRAPAQALLDDLKVLLHPDADPNVLRPLKKVLACHSTRDPNLDLVRMVYRLGLEENLDAVGLHSLVRTLKDLAAGSDRPTLAHLANVLVQAVREDDAAIQAAARVCRELFSTETSPERPVSNARQALPVVADLFANGIAEEALCAADSLIFGCGAGPRVACGEAAGSGP